LSYPKVPFLIEGRGRRPTPNGLALPTRVIRCPIVSPIDARVMKRAGHHTSRGIGSRSQSRWRRRADHVRQDVTKTASGVLKDIGGMPCVAVAPRPMPG